VVQGSSNPGQAYPSAREDFLQAQAPPPSLEGEGGAGRRDGGDGLPQGSGRRGGGVCGRGLPARSRPRASPGPAALPVVLLRRRRCNPRPLLRVLDSGASVHWNLPRIPNLHDQLPLHRGHGGPIRHHRAGPGLALVSIHD
jgi:hypothetical protein